jgi:hypothetical protein
VAGARKMRCNGPADKTACTSDENLQVVLLVEKHDDMQAVSTVLILAKSVLVSNQT